MYSGAMETYRAGRRAIVVVVAVSLVALLIVGGAQNFPRLTAAGWAWVFVILVLAGWTLYWLSSVQVSLHTEGIRYQSCLGSQEMRWDEVDRFYYKATRRSVNFIPVGTYHSFKLVGRSGQKLSIGDSVERASELGTKLIDLTSQALFEKFRDRFNGEQELDFGPIKLSRRYGVRIKGLFGYREIPLNRVASYRIEGGRFYIFSVGQKRGGGVPMRRIPNAFVLLGLLNVIYRPRA